MTDEEKIDAFLEILRDIRDLLQQLLKVQLQSGDMSFGRTSYYEDE